MISRACGNPETSQTLMLKSFESLRTRLENHIPLLGITAIHLDNKNSPEILLIRLNSQKATIQT